MRVDGGHALGGCDHRVFVNRDAGVVLTARLRPGNLRFQLAADGIEAFRVFGIWHEVVLDLNGLAGVDELLEPHFVLVGKQPALPLFEQRGDFGVHAVEGIEVGFHLFGQAGISVLIGGHLHLGECCADFLGARLEGLRPFGYDVVGLALAVCPDGDQSGQPGRTAFGDVGTGSPEVLGAHAEEGQSLALVVEGLGSGVLPLLRGLVHALEGFTGLLRAAGIVNEGHRARHDRRGNGQPDRRGLGKDGDKTAKAASGLADRCGKLADAAGKRRQPLRQLGNSQKGRADGSREGDRLNDLLALGFIQCHEAVHQFIHAVDQAVDRGVEIVAQLLCEQDGFVFKVDESALRRGVALASFLSESRVFFPCAVGGFLRGGKKLCRVDGAQQSVAQANLRDADVVEYRDGADSFLVHTGQVLDKRLKDDGGIGIPDLYKLFLGHAADGSEIRERLTASGSSHLHFDQRLGQRRAAHLCFDADSGKGRRKPEDLRFGKAHLFSGTSQAQGHFHDGRFGGGKIVAQVHQRGAEVLEQTLIHVHDVGELCQRGTCFLRYDVGAVAQVDHDAGKVLQRIIADA